MKCTYCDDEVKKSIVGIEDRTICKKCLQFAFDAILGEPTGVGRSVKVNFMPTFLPKEKPARKVAW